ncbi:MAG TPA: ribosomal protein S18-alanine N-acetyltransferase [Acidobacteriota bacterium]|nr:ribosomal protein S18-alanine N-acetyltransferase [Acidobacteriota bacterium]
MKRLSVDDVELLHPLESSVQLSFWGNDHYRRFLEECPEYFGCKAVIQAFSGREQLAGFFLARSLYENLEILKIGVSPAFQRQGIGTRLMEASYIEGLQRGCSRCFLEVRKSNQKAILFYHAHDFRIAGSRRDYYVDPVEDAWIMEKDL